MLAMARARGFAPEYVLFDGWYASLENLKQVRGHGWRWVTRLKANRTVTPRTGSAARSTTGHRRRGSRVHLQGYGLILVFRIVPPDGDTEYWATSDLAMDERTRRKYAEFGLAIENYHRGLKQNCGVERCQVRAARAQRNHIGCVPGVPAAGMALLHHRGQRVRGETEAHPKAVQGYLKTPGICLPKPSTA